jgi:hypothetical protein
MEEGGVIMTAMNFRTGDPGPENNTGNTGWNGILVSRVIMLALMVVLLPLSIAQAVNPDGDLRIEIISAYNLVVDSNVTAPPTYAPQAATLGAKICNDGTDTLTDVQAYIGDYNGGTGDTPGTYPIVDSDDGSRPADWTSDFMNNTGDYSLTHESGSFASDADASRAWVGTIEPGECKVEYWVVSYPQCVNTAGGVPQSPPCDVSITGGIKPDDDLTLYYDIWATGNDNGTPLAADDTRSLTMRNEISASANKIWPNGDNKVPAEYKDAIAEVLGWDTWTESGGADAYPGEAMSTQGIWYDLGNVGAGFDNDNDGTPDKNAWMQPIGDPGIYDPGCFRLTKTYGIVIVKLSGGGELLIPFEDQLYFEDIPPNTGAVGLVFYEFVALNGVCTGALSPYQEVASGYDNEKFSGDYGTAIEMTTKESLAFIEKNVYEGTTLDPTLTAGAAATLTYTLKVTNPDSYGDPAGSLTLIIGNPDLGTPLVVRDSIPPGTNFLLGSAGVTVDSGIASADVDILYSYDDGATWTTTVPVNQADDGNPATGDADNVTDIQWWAKTGLTSDDSVAGQNTMEVEFKVTVPAAFPDNLVPNTGCAAIGTGPCFDEDGTITPFSGTNVITGLVWKDEGTGTGEHGDGNRDASEVITTGGGYGINGTTVSLYYDVDGDGTYTAGDILWETLTTVNDGTNDGTYTFSDLPDGDFVVVVGDLPSTGYEGYTNTTDVSWAVTGLGTTLTSPYAVPDTGFASALTLEKLLVGGAASIKEGELVSYTIDLENTLYGTAVDGDANSCTRIVYASSYVDDNSAVNTTSSLGAPEGNCTAPATNCTILPFGSNSDFITVGGYSVDLNWGNITALEAVVTVDHDETYFPLTRNDEFNVYVTNTATSTTYTESDFAKNAPAPYDLGTDTEYLVYGNYVTADMQNSTFAGVTLSDVANLQVKVETRKDGGNPSHDLEIDAIGLRITTDQPCSRDSKIIAPLPLFDIYEADKLEFVSANPMPDSNAAYTPNPVDPDVAVPTNILTWDNLAETLGWLNPGQTHQVTVTFKALETAATTTVTNKAEVKNAYFLNGVPVNEPKDVVTVNLDPAATIGDFIWNDANGDGVQDGAANGEPGIPGVEVYICSGIVAADDCDPTDTEYIATAITDATGWYEFTGLTIGADFEISVNTGTLPGTGYSTTPTMDYERFNNGAITADTTSTISTITDADHLDFDWGFTSTTSLISGTVWEDNNGDAVQDATDDAGLATSIATLYDSGGNPVGSPVTVDASGYYEFEVTTGGNYYVVITPPADYNQTMDDDTGESATCTSNPTPACDHRNEIITVVLGDSYTGIDFAYQTTGTNSIGNRLYSDLNGDGAEQSGTSAVEPGIPNVTIYLYEDSGSIPGVLDAGDVLRATDITDATGAYGFTGLPDDNYLVVIDENDSDFPVGNQTSDPDEDGAFAADVDTDTTVCSVCNGVAVVDLNSTGDIADNSIDFGYEPVGGTLGDTIYWDSNGDGTQGLFEPGIEGVEVELFTFTDDDGDGRWDVGEPRTTTNKTVTTDANGNYLFFGLPADNYAVQVITGAGSPIGTAPLTADPGADGVVCPGAGTVCDDTHGVYIDGSSYMGADFGYQPPGVIGDQLFIDTDRSGGDMDANDAPIPYVTITLKDYGVDGVLGGGDDGPDQTTETDEYGQYSFINLDIGDTFVITVDTTDPDFPAALLDSAIYNGAAGDGTPDNTSTVVATVDPIMNVDFGYPFKDVNDLSGTVCLETGTSDGHCGAGAVGVTDGVEDANETAYTGTPVYVSKWVDVGTIGVIEPGELTQLAQTVTDVDGNYFFNGLPSVSGADESYVVSLEAPGDYLGLTTVTGNTSADLVKNILDPAADYTTSAWQQVSSDGDKAGLDFAFAQQVTYDFGDLPLPFETTMDIDGARHVVLATPDLYLGAGVTTETDGQPSAGATADTDDGVVPVTTTPWAEGTNGGKVEITTFGSGWLVGWIDFNGDGSFSGTDEKIIDQALGTADTTVVTPISFDIPADGLNSPGYARFRFFPEAPPVPALAFKGIADNGEVEDYLFDLSPLSTIGDTVLLDTTGNGIGDTGIEGAVVELQNQYCNAGVDCPTAVTDADGHYLFTGVGLGEYTVVVKELPSGLPVGTIPIYDPDSTLDEKTIVNITEAGTAYLDADFWYGPTVPTTGSIGDRIWNDADGNGVQDMGESGIGGITVELQDGVCTTSVDCLTTTTAADGSYIFPSLTAGNYTIKVINPPSGTTQTGDPDEANVQCSSSCDGSTTVPMTITASGETVLTADFGYQFPTGSTSDIGDLIYNQDTGDGIAGVTVVLKNSDGDFIAEDVTDASGNYLFPGLPLGTYTVEVTDANGELDELALKGDPDGVLDGSYTLTITQGEIDAGTNHLEADFPYGDPIPTYAVVSSFAAYVDENNQTILEWETASEIGTLGFLLERLNEQSGKYQAVTKQLLPGMLSPPHGGTYRYVDKKAEIGKSYTYRVVEVAVNNQGTVSGPYTVQAEQTLPVNNQMFADGPEGYTLTHEAFSKKQLKRFAARDEFASGLASAKKKKTGDTLKIPVSENGLVYLSTARLAATSGLSERQVTKYLKSKKCLVTLKGESIPVITANTGSGLWFYGQAPTRNDIGQNIYLLELGVKGVKMKSAPGRAEEIVLDEQSFVAHTEVEENHQPFHLYINIPVSDFWAWEYLLAYGGDYAVSHTVDTPHLTGHGTATITVNLVSVVNKKTGNSAPYKVTVLLNGHDAGTAEWSEKGDYQFQTEVAANLLLESGNEVKLVSQLNSGVVYSFIYLESIEVDYQRDYEAIKGELFFSNADYDNVTVKGFNGGNVLALDITDPNNPQRLRTLPGKNQAGEYTITVLTETGHTYFITENISSTVAGDMTVDSPSRLRSADNQADYLIISPLNMMDSAQRLADHRASEGMTAMIVDIEDVQDEFSHALAAPEAVHDFLAYAYAEWALVPRYVVLIGDGSYDYKDHLGYGYPLVPSQLVATPDAFFPSDNAFADVVGDDGVPEFAIGRIPAVDTAELERYIDKVIVYEQSLHDIGAVMALVTGRSDARAGDFQASAEKVAGLVPENFTVNRFDVDTLGDSGTHDQLVNTLQQGANILHYIGHSSMIGYGRRSSLLTANEIKSMSGVGSPMMMTSMACSSASFGYPPMNSIGESALLKADGAAVGFFGATGLSRNYLADIMAEGFYRSLFDPTNTRVGDAVVQGKQHYFDQGAKRYPLDIYNLLGDPAMLAPVQQ